MKKIILITIFCCWMSVPVHAQVPAESTSVEGTIWLFTSDKSYDYGNMWLGFSSGSIYRVHGKSDHEFRICNEMDNASYYNIGPIIFYKYTELLVGMWVNLGDVNFAGMLFPLLGMGFEWRILGPNIPIIPKVSVFYGTLDIEEVLQWTPAEECDELYGPFYGK